MTSGSPAATDPWWTPGSRHGYHANTYGYLVGELARRVTGRLPAEWLRSTVAGPLGADHRSPPRNLHAKARGIARLYAALAAGGRIDGVLVCDTDVLAEAVRPQSEGWCPFLERDVTFGLGFQPTRPDRPFGPNAGSFGHYGTGGSLGFADPAAGIAFGYVMNAVRPRWQNSRNRALTRILQPVRG